MKNKILCSVMGHAWEEKSYWNAARGDPHGLYMQCTRCYKIKKWNEAKISFRRKHFTRIMEDKF